MAKQPVRVQIFNQSYTLLADGDPREVQEIAHEIDELIVEIGTVRRHIGLPISMAALAPARARFDGDVLVVEMRDSE